MMPRKNQSAIDKIKELKKQHADKIAKEKQGKEEPEEETAPEGSEETAEEHKKKLEDLKIQLAEKQKEIDEMTEEKEEATEEELKVETPKKEIGEDTLEELASQLQDDGNYRLELLNFISQGVIMLRDMRDVLKEIKNVLGGEDEQKSD